jgi:hypothetical protein
MTTYQVTAWCVVPYYTTFELEANSIADALEKAKLQALDEYGEPCGGGESDWDEFEIVSEGDADEYVRHLEPERLAENAALELRDSLQRGINLAQQVVGSWEGGDLAAAVRALSQWLGDARTAINKTTKPQEDTL